MLGRQRDPKFRQAIATKAFLKVSLVVALLERCWRVHQGKTHPHYSVLPKLCSQRECFGRSYYSMGFRWCHTHSSQSSLLKYCSTLNKPPNLISLSHSAAKVHNQRSRYYPNSLGNLSLVPYFRISSLIQISELALEQHSLYFSSHQLQLMPLPNSWGALNSSNSGIWCF